VGDDAGAAQIPWEQIARALLNETRLAILELLAREGPASPKEMAQLLDVRLPNVSYHTTVLHEAGLLSLVKVVPRRGAREHFYELNLNGDSRASST
jgi:DNA-binding transcriptional ArsR family regulator